MTVETDIVKEVELANRQLEKKKEHNRYLARRRKEISKVIGSLTVALLSPVIGYASYAAFSFVVPEGLAVF